MNREKAKLEILRKLSSGTKKLLNKIYLRACTDWEYVTLKGMA